jgi:hypothetical protein
MLGYTQSRHATFPEGAAIAPLPSKDFRDPCRYIAASVSSFLKPCKTKYYNSAPVHKSSPTSPFRLATPSAPAP